VLQLPDPREEGNQNFIPTPIPRDEPSSPTLREGRSSQEALARAMARWAEAVETLEGLEGG